MSIKIKKNTLNKSVSAQETDKENLLICKHPCTNEKNKKRNGLPYCQVYKGICKCISSKPKRSMIQSDHPI
jgi:hypothetical protein